VENILIYVWGMYVSFGVLSCWWDKQRCAMLYIGVGGEEIKA
jgi:hypothetical protein